LESARIPVVDDYSDWGRLVAEKREVVRRGGRPAYEERCDLGRNIQFALACSLADST
jgi:hypothetical protein